MTTEEALNKYNKVERELCLPYKDDDNYFTRIPLKILRIKLMKEAKNEAYNRKFKPEYEELLRKDIKKTSLFPLKVNKLRLINKETKYRLNRQQHSTVVCEYRFEILNKLPFYDRDSYYRAYRAARVYAG